MKNYYPLLFVETYYHIFSRGNGNEKLFREDDNYRFFLEKYKHHILPVADTLAWCLLPNHFHFLIKIKTAAEIEKHFIQVKKTKRFDIEIISDFLMERFSNWLNSYTKAFNKVYQRKGNLFMDYLRRVEVEKKNQFGATVFYIHKNPVHHGLCKRMEDWQWSSYKAYISNKPTLVAKKEVLEWFGNLSVFQQYHDQSVFLKEAIVIE